MRWALIMHGRPLICDVTSHGFCYSITFLTSRPFLDCLYTRRPITNSPRVSPNIEHGRCLAKHEPRFNVTSEKGGWLKERCTVNLQLTRRRGESSELKFIRYVTHRIFVDVSCMSIKNSHHDCDGNQLRNFPTSHIAHHFSLSTHQVLMRIILVVEDGNDFTELCQNIVVSRHVGG